MLGPSWDRLDTPHTLLMGTAVEDGWMGRWVGGWVDRCKGPLLKLWNNPRTPLLSTQTANASLRRSATFQLSRQDREILELLQLRQQLLASWWVCVCGGGN